MREGKIIDIMGTLAGTCLSLAGFLIGLDSRGFHGMTLWFNFPAFIFCFCIFMITLFGD